MVILTLLAFRSLASAMDEDTRQAACAGAVLRHSVVWGMFGCNPATLPLHVAAIALVYGGHDK